MDKEPEQSLGNQQTRSGKKQAGPELDTARSLSDNQTLVGGLATDAETLSDGLELTDLSARYTIVKPLGQGGMGEVLLATDNRLKRQVAIKRIRGEHARSRAAVQRFLTEAQAVAALNHPNIVQVYDYGRDREGPFLIMEYVDGQSLLERCRDNPLPVAEAVELASELLGGLGRAHELGIIHRDIKPANVLLTKDGRPKLTDFGLAKQMTSDHGQTVTGVVLGTIDFMPPEQRKDSTQVDARSDLWSLAATLYQMLTGKSPKIIRFDLLPPQLIGVMGQALEENPAQRFQSAIEFRDGLRKVPQAEEVSAGELVAGQCPQCGTRNSESVRFCKECSAALKVPCLKCEADIAIWDKGCTECGTRQADFLERKRSELETLRGNVERLCEAGRLGEALQQLESIGELRHPRLQDYRHWVERTRPDLSQQAERLVALSGSALAEARAHRAAWDYRAAIQTLERLPPEAFGDDHRTLRAQLQTEWIEFQEKLQEIQQRVKARQLDGLLPLVERAVELRGNREDLKKLLGQLQQREAKLAASQHAVQADPLGDPFETSPGSVTLPGFLGKKAVRKSSLQQYRTLVTSVVVGLVLLSVAGKLLSRWDSGKATPASASADKITPPEPNSAPTEVAGSKPVAIEPVPASTSPSPEATPVVTRSENTRQSSANSSPIDLTNSIGMKLKLLPAGNFTMGSSEGGNETPHNVALTRPFYLGVYEVTQEQYERLMGRNPSNFKGARNPVEQVSWEDAAEFCRKLSTLPEEQAAGRVYRLPTESEWEYACRAGNTTKYCFGDNQSRLGEYAWYNRNSGGKTHPVGEKKPNDWGLYDMHGNVFEWCADVYSDRPEGSLTDPVQPKQGSYRVCRAGCYESSEVDCHSTTRYWVGSSYHSSGTGFRVTVSSLEISN